MSDMGKKFLLELKQRPGNDKCADCGAKGEEKLAKSWAPQFADPRGVRILVMQSRLKVRGTELPHCRSTAGRCRT